MTKVSIDLEFLKKNHDASSTTGEIELGATRSLVRDPITQKLRGFVSLTEILPTVLLLVFSDVSPCRQKVVIVHAFSTPYNYMFLNWLPGTSLQIEC